MLHGKPCCIVATVETQFFLSQEYSRTNKVVESQITVGSVPVVIATFKMITKRYDMSLKGLFAA